MPIQTHAMRKYLEAFDFRNLFTQVLGWNNAQLRFPATQLEDIDFTFRPVAEQGGMVVVQCEASNGEIPTVALRRKIEKHITGLAFEHILIFVDKGKQTALWQWIKREPGKSGRLREQTYRRGQSADLLLQKLAGIAFDINELDEEGRVSIAEVTGRVAKNFDVETVTKKFYDQFKTEHTAFLMFLKGIDETQGRDWYVSVMLNRLMFLYFIQKQGFLNGDTEYLTNKLAEMQALGDDLFYREFLLVLFFQGLASDSHDAATKQLLGKVPYLNGGLFLPHSIEERYGDQIVIPDAAFERLFKFFEAYTWHLDDRPLRKGNEINPDVLGYIFEKYINQKQMGAYYTKEDITGYICQNTILPFLLEKSGAQVQQVIHDIDPYIYEAVSTEDYLPTETEREYAARRRRYEQIQADFADGKISTINDLITYNLDMRAFAEDWLRTLYDPLTLRNFYFEGLSKLTVLDPTCGSGAFLFAAMNILEPLYELALDRMAEWVGELKYKDFATELDRVRQHPNRRYFIFKSIIVNNLYGVDIMEEAVEICKLRLFLKLVAQIEDVNQVEPLPDIDFNIWAGNSLIGFSVEEDTSGRLFVTDDVRIKLANVERQLKDFRGLQMKLKVGSSIFRQAKEEIRTTLNQICYELNKLSMEEYGQNDLEWFIKSHLPFHWYAQFNHVMKAGGFDVIVGNPPYVELRNITQYSLKGYMTTATKNLYSLVIERCLQLTKTAGIQGFIVPVSSVSTDGYSELQKLLKTRSLHYSSYDDRPSHLFDGLDKNTLSILLLLPSDGLTPKYHSTRLHRWNAQERETLFERVSYAESGQKGFAYSMPKVSHAIESSILSKIWKKPSLGLCLDSTGTFEVYYSRKVNSFLQILDFVPEVRDGRGNLRPPSEFKTLRFKKRDFASIALCVLNSTLFRWFLDVYTDGSHLNKREVEGFPVGIEELASYDNEAFWLDLSSKLSSRLRNTAVNKSMRYQHDTLTVQCIIPKYSKPIIDEIDQAFSQHYGFTDEELDFIINYDIKYRMGRDASGEGGDGEDE
ncbi:MAG: Eco57I restriction-modification methylase domain-containing protein [Anaerolineae bacterium]|nr:Eco57I restriction-modification methylase domain-containing protein [Anaerolineae bacterium]